MSEWRLCPDCHAGNAPAATSCWMCRSKLVPLVGPGAAAQEAPKREEPAAAAPPPPPTAAEVQKAPESAQLVWSATLFFGVLVSLAISAELARFAPGLLVLFLVVDLPVLGALLVTVVRLWAGAEGGTSKDRVERFAVRAVTGVAIGAGALMALLALAALLAVAAFIIAFIACLAMLSHGP